VKYIINGEHIIFTLGDSEGPKRTRLSLLDLEDNQDIIISLCTHICTYGYGKANYTQISYVTNFLRPIAAFFRDSDTRSPVSTSEWQGLILSFMNFYLCSNVWSNATAKTRIELWRERINPMLKFMQEEEVIPQGVCIPKIRMNSEASNHSHNKTLRHTPVNRVNEGEDLSKLLVDTSFSMEDSDYLDLIASECRDKVNTLKNVCIAHWEAMLQDHKVGNFFADKIHRADLDQLLDKSGNPRCYHSSKYKLVCSKVNPNGHYWAFAIIRRLLETSNNLDCIAAKKLRSLPYFGSSALKDRDYVDIIEGVTGLKKSAFNILPTASYIYHFAGILSGVDVAAICVLLTIEHPNLNPQSLVNAKIVNVRGKSFIVSTDNNGQKIFSVDKPRAKSRKYAILSPLAQEMIDNVIRLTQPIRRILKINNNKDWRYLFLGQQMGGKLGRMLTSASDSLTCNKSRSLIRMYPELVDAKLSRGTLSYSRVRNTMGVLKWFETGSIREMSRCLGNTSRVALEHYLPPSLIDAWNARIIRRFQNTLIILACSNEQYLLEASDFSSLGDLMQFISQLVFDYKPGSSPIANEIQKLASQLPQRSFETPGPKPDGIVNIKLCPIGIAYLYAFHEYALKNIPESKWMTTGVGSTVSPQQLIDTAILIKHACESEIVSPVISEIIEYKSLLLMHHEAIKLKPEIMSRLSTFHITSEFWDAA